LADLERSLAGAGLRTDGVDRARDLAGRALESIRATARGLRPAVLDDLGFVPALRALAEGFAGRAGVAVNLSAAPLPAPPAPEVEVAVYRVLQEALTNVARHAAATRVDARLAPEGTELVLVIQDDGRGFRLEPGASPGAGHAGLVGMRERVVGAGGRFQVESVPGRGVKIEVRLPLGASDV
jgi:signal transduction histidine kinase